MATREHTRVQFSSVLLSRKFQVCLAVSCPPRRERPRPTALRRCESECRARDGVRSATEQASEARGGQAATRGGRRSVSVTRSTHESRRERESAGRSHTRLTARVAHAGRVGTCACGAHRSRLGSARWQLRTSAPRGPEHSDGKVCFHSLGAFFLSPRGVREPWFSIAFGGAVSRSDQISDLRFQSRF